MKTIVQKYELLPLTRNKDIKDTEFYKQFKEGTKASQIIANEFVRIACQMDSNYRFTRRGALERHIAQLKSKLEGLPSSSDEWAKQNANLKKKEKALSSLDPKYFDSPDFGEMNQLVKEFRTQKTGLDRLPEFLYFKRTKSGSKAKKLHENRYMNDEGECYGYDILNNCSSRQLNSVKDIFNISWKFSAGKKLNNYYWTTTCGLGWKNKTSQNMPIAPSHICDGASVSGDDYKFELNEGDPKKSVLKSFGKMKDPVRVVVHRPFKGKLKTLEVVEKNDRLYACFTIELDKSEVAPKVKEIKTTTGLDFGIKDHVIDSEGNIYNFPKDKNIESRIESLQKILSTKAYRSNNWRKLNTQINKLREKQTLSHDYQINNFTKKIVDENDGIAVEDYKPSEIMKKTQSNKGLSNKQKANINKKALAGGIHKIKTQITYKSKLYGKHCELVDPAYTSQECSECGTKNTNLILEDREWDCTSCGAHHDRDHNAAKNIQKKAFG